MTERLYFRREYASRFYSWLPFGLTSILVEIPYVLVFSAFFMCGFYWTAGLVNRPENCGYFYLIVIFFIFWAITLGFLIAAISRNHVMACKYRLSNHFVIMKDANMCFLLFY